jgi:gamma-glutamyl:cysteine ligase YbdK (ATP-grasp superfamily)
MWWDVQLQPRYGTVEVRIMDGQSTVGDVAANGASRRLLAAGAGDRRNGGSTRAAMVASGLGHVTAALARAYDPR